MRKIWKWCTFVRDETNNVDGSKENLFEMPENYVNL